MTEKELKQFIKGLKKLGYSDDEIEEILNSDEETDWI